MPLNCHKLYQKLFVHLFIHCFKLIPFFCSIIVYNAYFKTIILKQSNWNQTFGANNFKTFVKVYFIPCRLKDKSKNFIVYRIVEVKWNQEIRQQEETPS